MTTETDSRLVGGRYELRQRLGAGGMADVYLATDLTLGRQVAVKLLASANASDPAFADRLKREARTAAALSNPHVVSVFDAGVVDGTPFLVMEYVPGPTLRDVLRRRGPLPEAEALTLAAEVADGLNAAHRAGFVHQDVKPANVLLDAEGHAKVADFGIARAATAATTTSIMGTANYISPEQAQGHATDARSDVYSLGALLFELLTGTPPFKGDSTVAITLQHVQATPPSPRALRPEISPAAAAVVLRALAKNPADRFASAADMRLALDDALTWGATVPVRTLSLPRAAAAPTAPSSKSRIAGAIGHVRLAPLVGLALLLLVGAAVALAHAAQPPDTAAAAAQPVATGVAPTSAPTAVPNAIPTGAPPAVSAPAATTAGPAVAPTAARALVTVPDLTGTTQDRVGPLLASVGLRLGKVDRTPSSQVPAGRVIDQNPAAGQAVSGNTEVAITVSSGAAPPTSAAPAPGPGHPAAPQPAPADKAKPDKGQGH